MRTRTAVVVGAGPSGLIAADVLSAAGVAVSVCDHMPTAGRKFLMAGRGGLNLTHAEPPERFIARYDAAAGRIAPMIAAFPPAALIAWAQALGQPTFVGSSGRVFPRALKASPLLRALLVRLAARGVVLRTRQRWTGWDARGALAFEGADGAVETLTPDATILALGGASWPTLGSTGAWRALLESRGVEVTPYRPANCGFETTWSEVFRARFAGAPLKPVALSFGGETVRGEAMVSAYGLEGGAIYALSAKLRDAIARDGAATLVVDASPDTPTDKLTERLAAGRGKHTVTERLRKAARLSSVAIGLIREGHRVQLADDAGALARQIKAVPITLNAPRPLERAISSAGGVTFESVTENLELKAAPNVFVAGEMLDWEAPTGGYLLQACFSSAVWAAHSALHGPLAQP